jgi:chromosome segregation ATPase
VKREPRGFRYELEAVQRTREWELEAARMELANAAEAMKRARDHLDALQVRFAAARHEWSRRASDGHALDLQWQRIAAAYLAELVREAHEVREELARLTELRDRLSDRAREAHAALAAIEKHRALAVEAHEAADRRAGYGIADEMWLQRPQGDAA